MKYLVYFLANEQQKISLVWAYIEKLHNLPLTNGVPSPSTILCWPKDKADACFVFRTMALCKCLYYDLSLSF